MDVFTLIREEHQRLRELLRKLESAAEGDGRNALFEQLRDGLNRHREAEEATFYAALGTLPEIGEEIEELVEQHVDIDELIQELEECLADDEAFLPQLTELAEEVEHHFAEEEGNAFTRARRLLTEEQAGLLGTAMTETNEG